MQTVAEFMEQGDDIIKREERRFAAHGRGKVAGEKSHRMLDAINAIMLAAAIDGIVHPRAAAFGVAGVKVEIELSN